MIEFAESHTLMEWNDWLNSLYLQREGWRPISMFELLRYGHMMKYPDRPVWMYFGGHNKYIGTTSYVKVRRGQAPFHMHQGVKGIKAYVCLVRTRVAGEPVTINTPTRGVSDTPQTQSDAN